MTNIYGFDLLASQVMGRSREYFNLDFYEKNVLQSPIEVLFLSAILSRLKFDYDGSFDFLVSSNKDPDTQNDSASSRQLIHMCFQHKIGFRRVDFLFFTYSHSLQKNRKLIVECDGHDFHEKTKEQSSRDKSKDRAATLNGFDTFRFTGSEIWKNPIGCAEQIFDWIDRGNRGS